MISYIINGSARRGYNVLKIVKSDTNRPDSKMRVYGKYFINDIIKGYNGDDFEIPSDFSSMSPKTQKLTAIQMTKTSYVYAIVILSRRPEYLLFEPIQVNSLNRI